MTQNRAVSHRAHRNYPGSRRADVAGGVNNLGLGGFLLCLPATRPRRQPPEDAARYAVKVKLLPVPQSTSFSGISRLARSMKFCPLQCIGITCSRSNFLSSAITCPR